MNLEIQIHSLMFSFIFGMFFSLVYNIFYKLLFCGNKLTRIIVNVIFNIIMFGIYFLCLRIINNGIVHLYFLISLIAGFLIGNIKTKKVRRYKLEYF